MSVSGRVTVGGVGIRWEDLNFDPERSGGPAATRPDDVLINNVFHSEFTSSNNQLCGAVEELPHKYKLGTKLYPHLHLFLKSGESAGTTGVTFRINWELRQKGSTTSGSVDLSATSAELQESSAQIFLSIFQSEGFDGAEELGSQLAVTLSRTGGNAGDVVVTTYGIHYQVDSTGSRKVDVK